MMFNRKFKIFIFFIIYISILFYINCQEKEKSEKEELLPEFNVEDLINKMNEESENKENIEAKENIENIEIKENIEAKENIENKDMNMEEKENIDSQNILDENNENENSNNINENIEKEEDNNAETNTEDINDEENNEAENINIEENEDASRDIFDNLNQNNESENIIKTDTDNKENIEYNDYIEKNMYNTEKESKLEKLKLLFEKYLLSFHQELLKYVPVPYDYLIMFVLGYFFMCFLTKGKSSISIKKKKKVDESIVFEIELKLREILKIQDKLKEKKNSGENVQNPKIENLIKMPDDTININKLIQLENKLNILMEDLCKRNKDDSTEKKLQNNICELQNKILEDVNKLEEENNDDDEEEEEEDDNEENEKKDE